MSRPIDLTTTSTEDLWEMLRTAGETWRHLLACRSRMSGASVELRRVSARIRMVAMDHEAIRLELINRGEIAE